MIFRRTTKWFRKSAAFFFRDAALANNFPCYVWRLFWGSAYSWVVFSKYTVYIYHFLSDHFVNNRFTSQSIFLCLDFSFKRPTPSRDLFFLHQAWSLNRELTLYIFSPSSRFTSFIGYNSSSCFPGDWVNDDSVTLFYRLRCVNRRRTAYIPNETGHRIYKFKEENRLESETFTHVTTAFSHHGRWRCQLQISKGVARAFYRWDSQYGEISLTMW